MLFPTTGARKWCALALVNEQLWIGHFDLWQEEGVIMYRNALLLAGRAEASPDQMQALLDSAVEAADQYYQVFQFVAVNGMRRRQCPRNGPIRGRLAKPDRLVAAAVVRCCRHALTGQGLL